MSDNELPMQAYYYEFSPTGVREVDEILSAVARAGRGFHHTEGWTEPLDHLEGPEAGKCYVDLIYEAAERAAAKVRLLNLEACSKEAVLAMTVARLGGEVEGAPTGRHNFLQRIDALVALEAGLGEAKQ